MGVALAGGASRRMGRDKARLEVAGTSLVERAARRLDAVCREVLVADGGRRLVPGRRSVADGPGGGPAAGILGAAAVRPGRDLLVLACDLPRASRGLLARLARPTDAAARVPRWRGGLEPLCALYRPAALTALAAGVRAGELALHRLLRAPELTVRWLEEEEIRRFGPPEELFLNLNRPQDLERLNGL